MAATLRAEWNALRRSRPGRRFQDRYEASQRSDKEVTWVSRFVRVLLALIAFAVGVVLVFIPGPAFVFFILAGSLLASESMLVARACDWTELRVRAAARWVARTWSRMSMPMKILTVSILAALGAGATVVLYREFFH